MSDTATAVTSLKASKREMRNSVVHLLVTAGCTPQKVVELAKPIVNYILGEEVTDVPDND